MRLIDNAWKEFNRLWSIRASVGFGIFTAVAGSIAFFANTLNPWLLLGVSVVVNAVVLPLLRVAKQADPK
jgi:hypothetical protein